MIRNIGASALLGVLPLLAAGQVQLVSGYNFGQFLGGGYPALDGTTGDPVGSVGSNYRLNVQPPSNSSGDFVGANSLAGNFSNGFGRIYWDGTNGSSLYNFSNGLDIIATDVGPNAVNGNTVQGYSLFQQGDGLNLALTSAVAGNKIAFVQNTSGFSDFDPDSIDSGPLVVSDSNLTFAASVGAPVTVSWYLNSSATPFATTNLSGSTQTSYSVDLPPEFYGQTSVTLVAKFSGTATIDNVQFNGVSGTTSVTFTFWKGGNGEWSVATSSTDWQNSTGSTSGAWTTGAATFKGTAGTVTVNTTAGDVVIAGLKFQVTGYTVAGNTLKTTTAVTPIQVGDGTAAGAAMTATISAAIAGTGGIDKTDRGTLVLSGANSYTGATKVTAGTLKINGDQTAATGAVTVASGGTLTGSGKTGGIVTVQDGGTLAGQSGSVFTVPGLVLNAASILDVALGAPSTTGLFQVNGNLTLDGTLNVTGNSGFGPGTYRLIDYTGTLTDNEITVGSAPASTSDFAVQTSVAKQVNLVFAATTLNIWGGGAGTWTADPAGTAWKNFNATTSGAWTPKFAIFQGTAGTVTVDNTAGPVILTGAQFATTGYTIAGGTLTTNTADSIFRVGDGTSGGSTSTATISSLITGTGGIKKTDFGTLVLSGANTYAGDTTVSSGKLMINGDQTTATGAISVASGATLGGTGTTGGDVTVDNGGTLAGSSGTSLTMGSLVLNANSNVDVSLGAPTGTKLFKVNGALTLDGILNVTNAGAFGAGLYRLFDYTGLLTNNGLTFGATPIASSKLEIQTTVANQVNLIYKAQDLATWIGGSGTWSAATGEASWAPTDSETNGAWLSGQALFTGESGTVTVDTTAGAVVIKGIQFAASDYTIEGNALTTRTANTPFRVGDGTEDGADMVATISAPITGSGGVDKTDLGTLVLSGTNTYTGGTRVTDGVLEVSDNTNLGSASGKVTLNGGTLRAGANLTTARSVTLTAEGGTIDTGTNTVTLSGVLSGAGALTKQGTGVLSVSGANNTNTGTTTISAGTLQLTAGSLGATTIASGARLTGNGTIRGNLANSGTLSPGASPGKVTVAGNYTQSATGSYTVEIASSSSYDQLVASGSATLGGSLVVTALNGYTPTPGHSFKIIDAAGGVSGTFASVTSPWANISAMVRFQTLYNPKDVTLRFTQLPFAGVTDATATQQAVGTAIDGAIAAGKISGLVAALNALPTETGVRDALSELSPLRYERWYQQAVYSAGATIRATESRLTQAKREPTGGLWLEMVRRESDFNARGESLAAKGVADGINVGADARVTPDIQLGVLFGYTTEGISLDDSGSTTDAKRFSASLYGRYDIAPFFVDAVLGATHTDLTSNRTVAIPGYAGIAESKTKSSERYISVRSGYTLDVKSSKITPYAGMSYVGWSADAFTETGAKDANLKLPAQSSQSLTSRAGVTFEWPFVGERITFTPKLDVAWRHEFREIARSVAAELGGSKFNVEGAFPASGSLLGGQTEVVEGGDAAGKNGLMVALEFDVTFSASLTAYARIALERKTAADQALEAKAGVQYNF